MFSALKWCLLPHDPKIDFLQFLSVTVYEEVYVTYVLKKESKFIRLWGRKLLESKISNSIQLVSVATLDLKV